MAAAGPVVAGGGPISGVDPLQTHVNGGFVQPHPETPAPISIRRLGATVADQHVDTHCKPTLVLEGRQPLAHYLSHFSATQLRQ